MIEPTIVVEAELRYVHDGDTYDFLLDVLRTHFRIGAVTAEIRLRDYSCPEIRTEAGRRALEVAKQILTDARQIVVELKGQRSFARLVGWVWVDGQSLGQLLVEAAVAKPGAFEG